MFLVQNALLFLLTINTRHGQMKRHKTLQCMHEVTPSNVKGTFSLCFHQPLCVWDRYKTLLSVLGIKYIVSTSLEFTDLFPICTLFRIICKTNINIKCNQTIIFVMYIEVKRCIRMANPIWHKDIDWSWPSSKYVVKYVIYTVTFDISVKWRK